jgi:hypothetical protein
VTAPTPVMLTEEWRRFSPGAVSLEDGCTASDIRTPRNGAIQ